MNKITKILTIFILGLGISISSYAQSSHYQSSPHPKISHTQSSGYNGIHPIEVEVRYECQLRSKLNSFTELFLPIGEPLIVITTFRGNDSTRLEVRQTSYEIIDDDKIHYSFPTILINSDQYNELKDKDYLSIKVYEEDLIFDDNPIEYSAAKESVNNLFTGKGDIRHSVYFSIMHIILTNEEKCTLELNKK